MELSLGDQITPNIIGTELVSCLRCSCSLHTIQTKPRPLLPIFHGTHGFGKAAAETELASYEENLFLEVYGGWKPNYIKSSHNKY